MVQRIALICGLVLAGAPAFGVFAQEKSDPWPLPRALGQDIPAYKAEDERSPSPPGQELEAAETITLRKALEYALANNPGLAGLAWEVKAMGGRVRQADLLPNPELQAEVENFGGSAERRGVDSAESTLAISQLIELGGKRGKRTRVARQEQGLAGWEYESKRLDVYAETAKAFMALLGAQQRAELKRSELSLAQKIHETVRERVRAGRASAVDETKARVALGSSQIEADRAQRELLAARDRLSAQLGTTESGFGRAEGRLDEISSLPPLQTLLERVRDNPDIARLTEEFALRQSMLALERARSVPDVTISAGVRRYEESDDTAFVAGASIPIPIFGMNPGGVMEAERRLPQSRERERGTVVNVTSALKQIYREADALFGEITTLTDNILPGAQHAYDAAREGYREGKFGFLDVLDAQRTLFQANERYIETAVAYRQAVLDVERLTARPVSEASPSSSPTTR